MRRSCAHFRSSATSVSLRRTWANPTTMESTSASRSAIRTDFYSRLINTYAKFIDNVASRNELAGFPGTGAFTDYYNQASNRGLSGNDVRHRFVWSSIYELPFG